MFRCITVRDMKSNFKTVLLILLLCLKFTTVLSNVNNYYFTGPNFFAPLLYLQSNYSSINELNDSNFREYDAFTFT